MTKIINPVSLALFLRDDNSVELTFTCRSREEAEAAYASIQGALLEHRIDLAFAQPADEVEITERTVQ